MGREQGMFFEASRKHTNRISMLIAMAVVLCALLWNEGGENLSNQTDPVSSAAQIMTVESPLVRIESTDEVYGTVLQAVIVPRLSAQSFKNKVASEFIYAILELLLAAVMLMLFHRPVCIWLHQSRGCIVCYIHNKDGKK